MKKYIILGWCGGMGGGHVYTKNKCDAARKAGWNPIVIHSSSKEVKITDLKVFQENAVIEMSLLPCFYSRSQQERIIMRMVDIIQPKTYDELFIESNGTRMAFWAELLARRLQCKHFAFLLEYFFTWHDEHIAFFLYKLKRNELSVIKRDKLKMLFNNRKDICYDDIPIMHPCCSNSVDDSEDTLGIDYSRYDVIIGNIGRNNKPYVESLGPEILKFALRRSEKKILFLMIGGEADAPIAKLQSDLFKDVPNLDYISTGYLYPIPQSVLSHLDLAIGTSGCIGVGVRNGIKTIAYADNDNEPYGLMGYDISERNLERNKHCGISLSDLLEDVLFGSYCDRYKYKDLYGQALSNDKIMDILISDIKYMTSPVSKEYYDTSTILPQQLLRKFYIKTIGRYIPLSHIIKFFNIL